MTYDNFFRTATSGQSPYAYQRRLACPEPVERACGPAADPAKPATLTTGTACASQLISIPTGLGKTAAVVLAWLWNRLLPPLNTKPKREPCGKEKT